MALVAALSLSDVSLALHASPVSAAEDATASFAISSKSDLFPMCCSKLLQAGGHICDAASHAVPAISLMRSQLLCEQLHPLTHQRSIRSLAVHRPSGIRQFLGSKLQWAEVVLCYRDTPTSTQCITQQIRR